MKFVLQAVVISAIYFQHQQRDDTQNHTSHLSVQVSRRFERSFNVVSTTKFTNDPIAIVPQNAKFFGIPCCSKYVWSIVDPHRVPKYLRFVIVCKSS